MIGIDIDFDINVKYGMDWHVVKCCMDKLWYIKTCGQCVLLYVKWSYDYERSVIYVPNLKWKWMKLKWLKCVANNACKIQMGIEVSWVSIQCFLFLMTTFSKLNHGHYITESLCCFWLVATWFFSKQNQNPAKHCCHLNN